MELLAEESAVELAVRRSWNLVPHVDNRGDHVERQFTLHGGDQVVTGKTFFGGGGYHYDLLTERDVVQRQAPRHPVRDPSRTQLPRPPWGSPGSRTS